LLSHIFSLKKDSALTLLLAAVNLIGGTYYGCNVGVVATALSPIQQDFNILSYSVHNITSGNTTSVVHTITPMSSFVSGLLVASFILGAFFGALTTTSLLDSIGRRGCIFVIFCIGMAGVILSSLMPTYWLVLLFRALLGYSCGISNISCTTYVAEMSPVSKRGLLAGLFPTGAALGILLSYIIGYAFTFTHYSWRFMFAANIFVVMWYIVLAAVMPESPTWLEMKQQNDTKSINFREKLRSALRNIVSLAPKLYYENTKMYLVAIVLCLAFQFTGGVTTLLYAPSIFISSGLAQNVSPIIPTIFMGLWFLISVLISLPLIRKFGRRPLILFGMSCMCIGSLLLGFDLYFVQGITKGIVAIPTIAIFFIGYNCGIGNLIFVVVNELFPTEVRAFAVGQLMSLCWFINLVINLMFPMLVSTIGMHTVFWIFAAVSLISIFILAAFLPETKFMVLSSSVPVKPNADENEAL
jgi:major inositol transporter-like SP family MFS transporter